jgi:hypothetical protein
VKCVCLSISLGTAPQDKLLCSSNLLYLVSAPVQGQGGVRPALKNLCCGPSERDIHGPIIQRWFLQNAKLLQKLRCIRIAAKYCPVDAIVIEEYEL